MYSHGNCIKLRSSQTVSYLSSILKICSRWEVLTKDLDQKRDQEFEKNGIFQCEICCDAFKGRVAIEAHITGQHSHIVKELEEDVGDFYALLRAASKQGSLYGM